MPNIVDRLNKLDAGLVDQIAQKVKNDPDFKDVPDEAIDIAAEGFVQSLGALMSQDGPQPDTHDPDYVPEPPSP